MIKLDRPEIESYAFMVIIFSLFWVVLPEVSAHELIAVRPDNTMFQTATFFPDPFGNSYFTLEEFEREGQSHWYAFTATEGQRIFIQSLVPDIDGSRNFTPCFDFIIGEDKVTPNVNRQNFFEEFSQTNWIVTCELDMQAPSDGLYYIRAHDELNHYEFGDVGKFSLAIGMVDNFDIFDWMQVPFWTLHVNLFFGNLIFVWIMLVLLVILGVIVFYYIKKRRDR